jgi:peptide/nickel transport system substrate-binding protein
MKKSNVVAVAVVIIAIIVVSTVGYYYYGPQPAKPTPTVVVGTTLDVTVNLDPAQDYSNGIWALNYGVFDTLYEIPPGIFPQAIVTPRLAAGEPIVSSDGLEVTIPVRQGVTFQDGTSFNASAMKFSLDRVKQLNGFPAWLLDPIKEVQVVDTYTIKIILNYPDAALKGVLSLPVSAAVSPSAVQAMGQDKFQELPVGSGPFKYVEWQRGDHITLAPFQQYWNQSRIPKVNMVYKIYKDSATMELALEKGEIDSAWDYVATSDYPSLLSNPDIKYSVVAEGYIQFLVMNRNSNSSLQDVRVRRAIEYAIDQDEISKKVYNNIYPPLQDTMFLPAFYPTPSWQQYKPTDIAKAKELLTEAGYPNGVDLTLSFTPIAWGKEFPDMAALIQEQLGRAGIRLKLQSTEFATFLKSYRAAQYELALGVVSPDYPDADTMASQVGVSNGAMAVRNHNNDTLIQQMTEAGRAETDSAKRATIYGDIQDRLADLAVYVPLVQQNNYWFYRTGISGVTSYYFGENPWWTLTKEES